MILILLNKQCKSTLSLVFAVKIKTFTNTHEIDHKARKTNLLINKTIIAQNQIKRKPRFIFWLRLGIMSASFSQSKEKLKNQPGHNHQLKSTAFPDLPH